jgi:ribose transport system substrate-binding protein
LAAATKEQGTSAPNERAYATNLAIGAYRMKARPIVAVLACAALLSLPGCRGGESREQAGETAAAFTIAVIPKGTTHAFWKSVEKGVRQAGEELGVKVIWKGPLKENDRASQISIVQDFVAQSVDAIVLAPLDATALKGHVDAAMGKGIPVVIFDSALDGEPGKDYVSLVATDNYQGGRMGGDRLAELLAGTGKVVLLRYEEGSASTMEREHGFLDVMAENPGIEVIVKNRYGGVTPEESQRASQNILDKLQQADGVFCPNESTTYGMLLALQSHNLAGKLRFVGFDASTPLVEGLRAGDIDALVVQNPVRMGYVAVKTAVQHLNGESVESVIDTGAALVTKNNMDEPEIAGLLE